MIFHRLQIKLQRNCQEMPPHPPQQHLPHPLYPLHLMEPLVELQRVTIFQAWEYTPCIPLPAIIFIIINSQDLDVTINSICSYLEKATKPTDLL